MSQTILIATLGEHPAVITGMVKALREIAGVEVDTLHVLHPTETGKYIGREGFTLIADHLKGTCHVFSESLPFADPNDKQTSRQFLEVLANLLHRYQDASTFHVYLSLAGGRKNMSALMALVTQFFPAIKGLYHLLDRREGSSKPIFHSSEYMELYMSSAEVQATLDPPLEPLNLVEIPHPTTFAESQSLWEAIKKLEADKTPLPIAIPPEAEVFWRSVATQQPTKQLDVWLSETAIEQYETYKKGQVDDAERFWKCFKQMRELPSLEAGLHHIETKLPDCDKNSLCVYKRTNRQRPLFYTEPEQISRGSNKNVEKVVICGLSIEYATGWTGEYKPTIAWHCQRASREPSTPLSTIHRSEQILLVPLGTSPMIATQTYALLQESETEGKPKIAMVAVLHTTNEQVKNGVRLLKEQFRKKGVAFKSYEVGVKDVDSTSNCEAYKEKLQSTIETLQQEYPDRQIALSLSGGRKGMSALTLFAAQYTGIDQLYHTLITDQALEQAIEKEGSYNNLQQLPTDKKRAEVLFLDEYDKSKFELFAIPIIPLSR